MQVKHLTVHTNFLPSADSLQADRDQIAQVLLTVIGHSIEPSSRGVIGATPSGSRTCWTELASRPLRQNHSRSFIKDV